MAYGPGLGIIIFHVMKDKQDRSGAAVKASSDEIMALANQLIA